MRAFDRPVLGGGLRFVFPPRPNVENDPLFEVKIESLLRDPRQMYVETQAVWEQPQPPNSEPDPRAALEAVLGYAGGPVLDFITRAD